MGHHDCHSREVSLQSTIFGRAARNHQMKGTSPDQATPLSTAGVHFLFRETFIVTTLLRPKLYGRTLPPRGQGQQLGAPHSIPTNTVALVLTVSILPDAACGWDHDNRRYDIPENS